MSTTTPHQRTAAAIQARRASTDAMLARIQDALRQMHRERAHITIAALARRAEVSHTFLYQNPDAHSLFVEAAAKAGDQRDLDRAHQTAQAEAAWRERALNAENALKVAHTEIVGQRTTIGSLLGRIRDLEHDLPADGIQRIVTENTTLKAKVRQLTDDAARLQERLHAARDNNRFLDKRLADLKAELADQFHSRLGLPGCPDDAAAEHAADLATTVGQAAVRELTSLPPLVGGPRHHGRRELKPC